MSNYLHLYYKHYIEDTGYSPESIISNTKEKIRNAAKAKLETTAGESEEIEKEFEQLYSLTDNEFKFAGEGSVGFYLNEANMSFISSFDSAIAHLKQMVKSEQIPVLNAINECNEIIKITENALKRGAETGGLANSACSEILKFQTQINGVRSMLKYVRDSQNGVAGESQKKKMLNLISSVNSNVSGYLLELAVTYAFLMANGKGLNSIQQMVNIGGHDSIFDMANLRVKVIESPELKKDLKKIEEALRQNGKTQSKVDAIFNLKGSVETGSGVVSAETSWAGFQIKNYRDITRIGVGTYSLRDIKINDFYDKDFLVNTTGSLGDNHKQKNIPKSLRGKADENFSQGKIDIL